MVRAQDGGLIARPTLPLKPRRRRPARTPAAERPPKVAATRAVPIQGVRTSSCASQLLAHLGKRGNRAGALRALVDQVAVVQVAATDVGRAPMKPAVHLGVTSQ